MLGQAVSAADSGRLNLLPKVNIPSFLFLFPRYNQGFLLYGWLRMRMN
jgi:hypothetical protein